MIPQLGKKVLYRTTAAERSAMPPANNAQFKLPAEIVSFTDNSEGASANLKVTLDGYGAPLWKTSCAQGDSEGTFAELS